MIDDLVFKFAKERQLANAYMNLAREHLVKAKEHEDRIRRMVTRAPLTKNDRKRLTTLIETGEIEQEPIDVPF